MSEIINKFKKMNNDLSIAAREMSGAEYSQLFHELDRLRSRARNNEASALGHARREGEQIGEKRSDEKWQGVVAEKDAENESLRRQLAELKEQMRKTR